MNAIPMQGFRFKLFSIFTVLMLSILACSFNASTAKIQDARLTSDEAGAQATTVFSPTDVFYLIVDLANAPDDTKVKASWTAVEVEGSDPNTLIDDAELTSGSSTLTFNLSNSTPWPTGKYKVDLYLNDKLDRTLEFEVQ